MGTEITGWVAREPTTSSAGLGMSLISETRPFPTPHDDPLFGINLLQVTLVNVWVARNLQRHMQALTTFLTDGP
jgi:hypothetical protein